MSKDEELDFLDWWEILDDIDREEYNRYCEAIENENNN